MNPQTFQIVLMLARVCVSEVGWQGHDECTVIVHAIVHQAQQRGLTIEEQICAYAPNSCNPRRRDRRRWISHLHPERSQVPPGWPRGMIWSERRAQFVAMLLVAHRAYLGEIPSACPGAFHWGAPGCGACRRRMREYGFVRAGCDMRNFWYRRR